jgi:uncharacterized membrane protein
MPKISSTAVELKEQSVQQNSINLIINFMRRIFTENNKQIRTLYKAISYRILGSMATVLISYFLTHELSISLSIGALELIGKIVLYYVHETIWENIS